MKRGIFATADPATALLTLGLVTALAGSQLVLTGCSWTPEASDEPVVEEELPAQDDADATADDEQQTPEVDVQELAGEQEDAAVNVEELAGNDISSSVGELAGDAGTALPADDAGTSFDSWAAECLDGAGNVTAYALSELKGWQLETLLQQQEYSWSTRNQLWVNADGSVAVVVRGADGKLLSDDKIAELGQGCVEGGASYRIVTGLYDSPAKAFDALVGKVMVCEDREFAETSGVAVVYGPSMHQALVFVSMSNDVVYLSFYSEEAVRAGLFNEDAGRVLGSSIKETFQTLTGRTPGGER